MDPKAASSWGAIATSIITMITFSGCLVASFFFHDPGLLNLAVGAAIANATTVVQFWLGSSASKQRQDVAMAALAGVAQAVPAPTADGQR